MPRLLLAAAAALWALLLANCAGPMGQLGDSRSTVLANAGYSPLRLQKTPGDTRYSGRFQVNGKPVQLLIDSGANSTDLDAGLARQLGIQPDRTLKVVSRGALGRPVTSKVGLGTLTAGQITAAPFPFMLAPTTTVHTATSRYDGQMGLDALSGLGALVDLDRGQLWLPSSRASNARPGSIRPLGPTSGLGFETLPLRPARRLPHLILESSWNGRRLTWVVDTGAEVSVLAEESAKALGIATARSASRIIDASGDRAEVRIAYLRNVVFNRLVVSEFQVAVTSLGAVRDNFRDRNGRPIDGIVGMDFLEESAALLDSASGLLYVGKP
ncbi:MAG: clan AA aspartic protease [Akkermansiaceae bacterium]|nr:clan AA aspartic protease [Akkermansiaceae bacterium]NNM31139.1 clan AA aspartic protease [Akkermansiaceae bacterium]